MKKFTAEEKKKFISEYQKSAKKCAEIFKLNIYTCYYWARKFGVKKRGKHEKINMSEFKNFYLKNSVSETAKKFKTTPFGVYKIANKNKIEKEKRWTKKDILFVKENFNSMPIEQLARLLNRSVESIKNTFYKK